MIVHVFKCKNNSQRYGFSQLINGDNIPIDHCTDGWLYWKTVTLVAGNPIIGIEVNSVIDIITRDGFAIQEATINFLEGEN